MEKKQTCMDLSRNWEVFVGFFIARFCWIISDLCEKIEKNEKGKWIIKLVIGGGGEAGEQWQRWWKRRWFSWEWDGGVESWREREREIWGSRELERPWKCNPRNINTKTLESGDNLRSAQQYGNMGGNFFVITIVHRIIMLTETFLKSGKLVFSSFGHRPQNYLHRSPNNMAEGPFFRICPWMDTNGLVG